MVTQMLDWRNWLLGLSAALIGGFSGGVVSGLTAMGIAPDKFNLTTNLSNTLYMAGVSGLLQGALSMFFYLKQSPVPKEEPPPPSTTP